MKISSVCLLTLFVVFNFFGVSCGKKFVCKREGETCYSDLHCCSKKCKQPFLWFNRLKGYCLEPNMPNGEVGWCLFLKKNFKEETQLINSFGLNAAHHYYPPGTLVTVESNDVVITVQINDEVPIDNRTILEISEAAAKRLGVENQELFTCKVEQESLSYYAFIGFCEFLLVYTALVVFLNLM